MNEIEKISITEIDRENWRFILYESEDETLYGSFVYSPQSFIDLSMIIELTEDEKRKYESSRIEFLKFADEIRFNHNEYIQRRLDEKKFKFINRPIYNIVSIDLNRQESIKQLHTTFKQKLNFPDFYGMNWDAFWDVITGESKMPTNLILYNYKSLGDRFKDSASQLSRIKVDFNKLNPNKQIHFDYKNEIENIHLASEPSSLFKTRPFQYGLRGDLPLWDDLEEEFKQLSIPKTEDELITNLYQTIEKLTGLNLLTKEKIYVERYNKGGMSGGTVSGRFWLKKGIPLIIGRYREMKKADNT